MAKFGFLVNLATYERFFFVLFWNVCNNIFPIFFLSLWDLKIFRNFAFNFFFIRSRWFYMRNKNLLECLQNRLCSFGAMVVLERRLVGISELDPLLIQFAENWKRKFYKISLFKIICRAYVIFLIADPQCTKKANAKQKCHNALQNIANIYIYINAVYICRERNIFEIFLNQTEIRLYLPFSDWFGSKRMSVWFQINRKMVNTIWFLFDLIRFRKDFSVCSRRREKCSSAVRQNFTWCRNGAPLPKGPWYYIVVMMEGF